MDPRGINGEREKGKRGEGGDRRALTYISRIVPVEQGNRTPEANSAFSFEHREIELCTLRCTRSHPCRLPGARHVRIILRHVITVCTRRYNSPFIGSYIFPIIEIICPPQTRQSLQTPCRPREVCTLDQSQLSRR